MNPHRRDHGAFRAAASAAHRSFAWPHRAAARATSARRRSACRRSSMSPAPMARARPSPSCARRWRRRASASMSTPRPISCASTSASGSPASSSTTSGSPTRSSAARRSTPAKPISVFEITTAAGLCAVQRDPGRLSAARSRARRPLRRDQCHRPAGGDGRSRRFRSTIPNFSARQLEKIALRKGRHPQARRAGDHRRAG